ncbi:MAG: SusC/RagA family TonB-linked outer membrane protein [Gemmatimonadetes bacterium]|nr:MAG: SusC/RagA family TonB-linked outer membrane protein [Gemmatimonadota bacterium]
MQRLRMALALSATLAATLANAQGQTRAVTGTVVEEGAAATPLSDVQVRLRGTNTGTTTRENGGFTIRVPIADAVLEFRRIGYSPTVVTVAAGTSTVAATMKRDALKLDQVIVSGQASEVSRRNLANSVAVVSAEEITKVSTSSIESVFQGKIAGAQMSQSTGAPGGGNRVRIRGTSSILGAAQPLYVIDGVIVSDVSIGSGTNKITRAAGSGISVGNQEAPANRISDLNPNDIESMEVLKGSAAAAIYGSKASAGVIIITTKRGAIGRPQWTFRTGLGTSRLAYKNGQRKFQSLDDATTVFGAAAATYWDANRNLSYEDIVYSNKPVNQETSLGVSGGSETTKYFASVIVRDEQGIVHNTFARKYGLRLNLDQKLSDKVDLQIGSEVLRTGSDRGLFGNDNAGNSIAYTLTKVPSFLDLRQNADGTWPRNPFYPSNPLQTIALFQNREWVWRYINTARLNANLFQNNLHNVKFIAYGGADVFTQRNTVYSPPELQYEASSAIPGTSVVSYSTNVQSNMNLNLVDVWSPRPWITATTQFGTQFERRTFDQTRSSAQDLQGGLAVMTAGTVISVDETRLLVEDFGWFGQAEVLLNDKVLMTLGVRADRSSNNGDPGKFFYFPKASASYRWPDVKPGLLDELKFRLAYGETGNQPQYGQKFTALVTSPISGLGGFQVSSTRASANLRPERQREVEGGVDATVFGKKGTIEVTGFVKNVSDLLITRTMAPSTGHSSETSNGAGMRVSGGEVAASFFAVNRGDFSWTTRLNWGANRTKITYLPVPTFLLGSPQTGAVQIELGKSATQIVANDTLRQPGGRVVVPRVIGDGNPLWVGGVGNEVRYGPFTFYALVDRQAGGMLANGTWRHYDLGQNSRDYDDLTSTGQKLGQVRRTTYLQVASIYYQDASFTKLRELSLSYDVPRRISRALWAGSGNAKLTVAGRNLAWWTNFRGGDPEAQNFGQGGVPDSIQRNRELAAYPASRSYWLTFSVDF